MPASSNGCLCLSLPPPASPARLDSCSEDGALPIEDIPEVLCLVEAPVVAAQPLDACGPLANAAELNGSVALVARGS